MRKEEATANSDLSGNDEGPDEVERVMGIAAMPEVTMKEKACRTAAATLIVIAGIAWYNSMEASTPPVSYLQ